MLAAGCRFGAPRPPATPDTLPRMRGVSSCVLMLSLLAACSSRPKATAVPSVALDPAQPTLRLPRNFVPAGYRVRLAVDPARTQFDGSIEIDGDVRERSSRIWLHGRKLAIGRASIARGGRAQHVAVTAVGDDLLSLRPDEPLDPGRYTL